MLIMGVGHKINCQQLERNAIIHDLSDLLASFYQADGTYGLDLKKKEKKKSQEYLV